MKIVYYTPVRRISRISCSFKLRISSLNGGPGSKAKKLLLLGNKEYNALLGARFCGPNMH